MVRWVMMALWVVGCSGDSDEGTGEPCTEGQVVCEGDVLVECVDGEEVETDCAAEGLMCHEEMGHCMAM